MFFFPDTDKYEIGVNWKGCRNEFLLIHNPFASKPLPRGLFPVAREAIANIDENHVVIKIKDN